jgi:hypothetical protein
VTAAPMPILPTTRQITCRFLGCECLFFNVSYIQTSLENKRRQNSKLVRLAGTTVRDCTRTRANLRQARYAAEATAVSSSETGEDYSLERSPGELE